MLACSCLPDLVPWPWFMRASGRRVWILLSSRLLCSLLNIRTFNPGHTVKVSALNPQTNEWIVIWKGEVDPTATPKASLLLLPAEWIVPVRSFRLM